MPLDRIPGEDNLYIGSAYVVGLHKMLDNHGITHILSVLSYTDSERAAMKAAAHTHGSPRTRIFVDVDDTEDDDLLVHFPRIVRYINGALAVGSRGAVYVHCAMGKSRSATAVIAFLLWKYPDQFRGDGTAVGEGDDTAEAAVQRALRLVRKARPIVEPNPGFMKQLALWWRMGCPADSEDAVERQPMYQRWLYQKDVEGSTRIGRAPGRLWFSDEAPAEAPETLAAADTSVGSTGMTVQLRCKMCRRMLAGSSFILSHNGQPQLPGSQANCPHFFIEPLSWMRPELERGELEGRLACPNPKCNASIGRYSWQGFKCTCRAWVCPAFSLQKSKVDRVVVGSDSGGGASDTGAGTNPYNIRLPPGTRGPSKV